MLAGCEGLCRENFADLRVSDRFDVRAFSELHDLQSPTICPPRKALQSTLLAKSYNPLLAKPYNLLSSHRPTICTPYTVLQTAFLRSPSLVAFTRQLALSYKLWSETVSRRRLRWKRLSSPLRRPHPLRSRGG